MTGRRLGGVVLLLGLAACSAAPPPPIGPQSALTAPAVSPPAAVPVAKPVPKPAPGPAVQAETPREPIQTGRATWYKRSRHTHTTASGEALDDTLFTAAHRTLPLGSFVEVTDTGSGEAVIVRINDRGPFTRGFIIDLSRSAAETLGLLRDHRIVVSLTPLPAPPGDDHPAVPISTLPTGKAALAALTPPKASGKAAAAKARPGKAAAGKPGPVKVSAKPPAAGKAAKPAPKKAPLKSAP